jgi:hypothetical protein
VEGVGRPRVISRSFGRVSVSGGRALPIETRRQRMDAEAERLSGVPPSLTWVTFDVHILDTCTHSYQLAASKTGRPSRSPGHSAS